MITKTFAQKVLDDKFRLVFWTNLKKKTSKTKTLGEKNYI